MDSRHNLVLARFSFLKSFFFFFFSSFWLTVKRVQFLHFCRTRPATLRQCKDDWVRRSPEKFGLNAHHDQVWLADNRRKGYMSEGDRVTKDVKDLVESRLYGKSCPGGNTVCGMFQGGHSLGSRKPHCF